MQSLKELEHNLEVQNQDALHALQHALLSPRYIAPLIAHFLLHKEEIGMHLLPGDEAVYSQQPLIMILNKEKLEKKLE